MSFGTLTGHTESRKSAMGIFDATSPPREQGLAVPHACLLLYHEARGLPPLLWRLGIDNLQGSRRKGLAEVEQG